MSATCATTASLQAAVLQEGYAFVNGGAMRDMVAPFGSLADWDEFADSWNTLEVDTYMADGGRYRRRRHAVYEATRLDGVRRAPHQPHYQALDYNPLNGGVARWFQPIGAGIGDGPTMRTLLGFCQAFFGSLLPATPSWRVEVHQFRIEARPGEAGQPTPEGLHRDGVDFVLVLLVNRENIVSGTTTVFDPAGAALGSFTLTDPCDAALVDDHRVAHGVTPVAPFDPARPGHRDVLVVTFKARP